MTRTSTTVDKSSEKSAFLNNPVASIEIPTGPVTLAVISPPAVFSTAKRSLPNSVAARLLNSSRLVLSWAVSADLLNTIGAASVLPSLDNSAFSAGRGTLCSGTTNVCSGSGDFSACSVSF
ncbi:hypothetical protein D3C71_1619370 [compost metagenome]